MQAPTPPTHPQTHTRTLRKGQTNLDVVPTRKLSGQRKSLTCQHCASEFGCPCHAAEKNEIVALSMALKRQISLFYFHGNSPLSHLLTHMNVYAPKGL